MINIITSKSFDKRLLSLGLEIAKDIPIIDKNMDYFVNCNKYHDANLISYCLLQIPAEKNRPALIVHFNCSVKEIELTEIELCFDFQRQAEAQLHFKPRVCRKHHKRHDDETRQLFLSIFR